MNRPKAIGTAAETAVARYLAAHGFPSAERRALRGIEDAGDITGCPGICVEVKGGEAAKNASDLLVTDWLEETEKERLNARADIGVLVLQRRGVGPTNAGRWWAILRLDEVANLAAADLARLFEEKPEPFVVANPAPVRMHLADAVRLLRAAGYGDPIDAEVSA
jgi:hypothetical protein